MPFRVPGRDSTEACCLRVTWPVTALLLDSTSGEAQYTCVGWR